MTGLGVSGTGTRQEEEEEDMDDTVVVVVVVVVVVGRDVGGGDTMVCFFGFWFLVVAGNETNYTNQNSPTTRFVGEQKTTGNWHSLVGMLDRWLVSPPPSRLFFAWHDLFWYCTVHFTLLQVLPTYSVQHPTTM